MGSRSRSGIEAPAGVSPKILIKQAFPVPFSDCAGLDGSLQV